LPDLVIYSLAVPKDNVELKAAKKLKIKCQTYSQALGDLTKKYWTIAVAGTHGKGTTSAILSLILIKAGFDPTVIIGTKLKEFDDSNFREGKSRYLIIEADEAYGAFLNYWPKMIILTNIEREHLDYYRNLKHILQTYKEFIGHLPKEGTLIFNGDDKNIQKLIYNLQFTIFKQFSIYNLQFSKSKDAQKLKKILKIPGTHNAYNALAALTCARALKIPDEISFRALFEYKGSWRRFEEKELKIGNCKLKIIVDYAHHPTEIEATLKAVREKFPQKEIWLIFQPHQYQRTFYLFDGFVKALGEAPVDKIIITDIFEVAGRETKQLKKQVSSQKLARAIKKNFKSTLYLSLPLENIARYLKENLKGKEVVVVMGAGDIYKLVDFFHLT
jgi:UDP-N-acetylmuramate--alanine ligase